MSRGFLVALALTAAGFLVCAVGLRLDARQALASWLAAFSLAASFSVGALTLLFVADLTRARWAERVRPLWEALARAATVLALLFVPLAVGAARLYPVDVPLLEARGATCLLAWVVLAWLAPRRSPRVAAAGLLVVLATSTVAAFDWLAPLTPGWTSSAGGVIFLAGGVVAAAALAALAAPGPRLALLLLAAALTWTYLAAMQAFVLWAADLPAEAAWLARRTAGSWKVVAALLLVGHLAPAVALLPAAVRRSPRAVSALGAWLVALRLLDLHWQVLPALHSALAPRLTDLAALLAVGGLAGLGIRAYIPPAGPLYNPPDSRQTVDGIEK